MALMPFPNLGKIYFTDMRKTKFKNKIFLAFMASALMLSSANCSFAKIVVKESNNADITNDVRSYSNTGSNFSGNGTSEKTGDASSSSSVRIESGSPGETSIKYDVKAEANGQIAQEKGVHESSAPLEEKTVKEEDGAKAEAGISIALEETEAGESSFYGKISSFFDSLARKIGVIFK